MSDASPHLSTRIQEWRSALSVRRFVVALVLTLLAAGVVLGSLPGFLQWVEGRSGVVLRDPVQAWFDPIDLSWLTFILIYTGLAVALTLFSRRPRLLVTSLQAYTLLMLCRMLMMWLIPLDPPENMILLRDPFLELLVGSGEVLTRDLFFSGHTSLPFLLFLVARERRFRTAFLLLTIAVGSCVILQHVHYTFDVVVAPFVAYGCYRLAVHIRMAAKAW